MDAIVETFPVGLLRCNCTVVGDPDAGEALVVDPGDEGERVLAVLKRHGLRCVAVVNTHAHIDHVGANHAVRAATGARVMLHAADLPLYDNLVLQSEWMGGMIPAPPRAEVDAHLVDGGRVAAGGLALAVLHTPGHTPGSVCFHFQARGIVFSGDTLFAGGIGRTDLWGGDPDQELRSIRDRLLTLEDDVTVVPGHGPHTSIGVERRRNPFLVGL